MRIFQVDAFTATRFTGNPATVVLDADGQSDATFAAIAREFAHAEAAFVLAAAGSDHDVRLRFFNARKEAPFVGHATVAAHAVLLALGQRGEGRWRQNSGTGIIAVAAEQRPSDGGARPFIAFRQAAPELGGPVSAEFMLQIAAALRLPPSQLHGMMPARVARKGAARLLIPLADIHHLDALAPDMEKLVSLGREIGVEGFFAFAVRESSGDWSTESRMFCPALGLPEDPVSGNAHAMLAAYLWDHGQFGGKSSFIGHQGRQMGRPGQVHVGIEVERGSFVAAHIGGSAVIISEGTLKP